MRKVEEEVESKGERSFVQQRPAPANQPASVCTRKLEVQVPVPALIIPAF